MAKTGYTEPRLHDYGGNTSKEWYVQFYMTNPDTGERKPFQSRAGSLNYHKKEEDRRKHGEALARQLKRCLDDGWNPFYMGFEDYLEAKDRNAARQHDIVHVIKEMARKPFSTALQFAFDEKKKSLEGKSISSINTVVKLAINAAKALGIHNMPIGDTETGHIMYLLNKIVDDRQKAYNKAGKGKKVTGNLYNKYLGYLSLLFTGLKQYGCVKHNPCFGIEKRTEIKTNVHRHATAKEHEYIKQHLSKDDPSFYMLLLYEYYTGIRPGELLKLRICDIDRFNQCIKIHATNGRSKDKTARMVPIPDVMLKDLEAQKLFKYPEEYYIFSSYFEPGPEMRRPDYATKRWNHWVKERYKLDVSMYSFKGKGGEDKRRVGVDFGAVSAGMGHSSLAQTVTYVPSEIDRMNEQLKMRTPKF